MKKTFRVICAVICLLFVFSCQKSFAGDAIRKFGRGLSNTALCWVDVPAEIFRTAETSPEVSSFIVGTCKGFFKALGRLGVGLYEVATFLVPIPAHYDPIIEPEFIF